MIPQKVKALFEKQALVAFATADKNGKPNVVPVFWKKISGNCTILLIDNYFNATKSNLLENKNACLAFWNPETEEAYKLKGQANYHFSGKVFEQGKAFLQSKKSGRIPRGVVELRVKEIFTITPGPDAGKQIKGISSPAYYQA